jgi:hypothetical protein
LGSNTPGLLGCPAISNFMILYVSGESSAGTSARPDFSIAASNDLNMPSAVAASVLKFTRCLPMEASSYTSFLPVPAHTNDATLENSSFSNDTTGWGCPDCPRHSAKTRKAHANPTRNVAMNLIFMMAPYLYLRLNFVPFAST